jgi:hypothetical protein
VNRRELISWTTVSIQFIEKPKNGNTTEMELRYTGIWGKRGANGVLGDDAVSASLPED